jgi:hypothetical protein
MELIFAGLLVASAYIYAHAERRLRESGAAARGAAVKPADIRRR